MSEGSIHPQRETLYLSHYDVKWIERLVSKTHLEEPSCPHRSPVVGKCWSFTGALSDGKYASLKYKGKAVRGFRKLLELLGQLPDENLHVDHLCRNTRCVNPAHLEPVSNVENQQRKPESFQMSTGTCKRCGSSNGHVEINSKGRPAWRCKPCRNAREKMYRARSKQDETT